MKRHYYERDTEESGIKERKKKKVTEEGNDQ